MNYVCCVACVMFQKASTSACHFIELWCIFKSVTFFWNNFCKNNYT